MENWVHNYPIDLLCGFVPANTRTPTTAAPAAYAIETPAATPPNDLSHPRMPELPLAHPLSLFVPQTFRDYTQLTPDDLSSNVVAEIPQESNQILNSNNQGWLYRIATNQRRTSAQTPSPIPSGTANHLEEVQSVLMDITPPKSPREAADVTACEMPSDSHSQTGRRSKTTRRKKSHDDKSNSGDDSDIEDIERLYRPKIMSNGKIRMHKCAHCAETFNTKADHWVHVRNHMNKAKIQYCTRCPFATDLKHHFEYHMLKHNKIKPFKCSECTYACENRSMLNSHLKSHSDIFRYRCKTCQFVSKYCHAFKKHLRSLRHQPDVILDDQGVPNPEIRIDIWGNRRGPRLKVCGGAKKRSLPSMMVNNYRPLSASQLTVRLEGFQMTQQPLQLPEEQQPEEQQPAEQQQPVEQQQPTEQQKPAEQQRPAEQPLQNFNSLTNSPANSPSSTSSEIMQTDEMMDEQQQRYFNKVLHENFVNLVSAFRVIQRQNSSSATCGGELIRDLGLRLPFEQTQQAINLSPAREGESEENNTSYMQSLTQVQQPINLSPTRENSDNGRDQRVLHDVESVLDLSPSSLTTEENETSPQPAVESDCTPILGNPANSRRRGRVLKLETSVQDKSASTSPVQATENAEPAATMDDGCDTTERLSPLITCLKREDDDQRWSGNSPNLSSITSVTSAMATARISASDRSGIYNNNNHNNNNNNNNAHNPRDLDLLSNFYECTFCGIIFKDQIIYSIHMGYHSRDDAFKCNMCGTRCESAVGLFIHMATNAHS